MPMGIIKNITNTRYICVLLRHGTPNFHARAHYHVDFFYYICYVDSDIYHICLKLNHIRIWLGHAPPTPPSLTNLPM